MKGLKLGIVGLMVLALGALSATTANAQTEVIIMPTNLTVAGTRCCQKCTLQRTLLLRSSDLATNLQVIPSDLNCADGISLSATIIRPRLTAN